MLPRRLDAPQHGEWPRDDDRRETAALFDSRVKRLEDDFALGTEEAPTAGELDPGDLRKADRALGDLGYAVLPEELLESTYDGPSRLHHHVERPSRWHRFFGTF
ncbi:hypothetical protein NJO91_12105 [Streptomyces microflavus]|uniref:hypothetical protein n=1 Tax=Streptomyces microflavus TaxID=1919 RepID=UPI0029A81810|nr:hypothetical protein [Streptomyces microflavus]MDX2403868.1 hypothetical protein [Streptomyces microflavus]